MNKFKVTEERKYKAYINDILEVDHEGDVDSLKYIIESFLEFQGIEVDLTTNNSTLFIERVLNILKNYRKDPFKHEEYLNREITDLNEEIIEMLIELSIEIVYADRYEFKHIYRSIKLSHSILNIIYKEEAEILFDSFKYIMEENNIEELNHII